ncbi:MAG: TIGR01458 family HAD-type hydrolase [Ignavibacteriaceae bacterium]
MKKKAQKIPVLIDFDGVLKLIDRPAPETETLFNFLSDHSLPGIIISNSTLRTSEGIKKFFQDFHIHCPLPAITAAEATLNYVKDRYKKVAVYCVEEIKMLFDEMTDYENPEAVILGDMRNKWNYELLNEIFRKVYNGADLIAMQKNRFWSPDGRLSLDAGAFISAIEYATSKKAALIGKPSPIYFRSALELLSVPVSEKFIMIGDDIETDIIAAQNCGATGILVLTGKTTKPVPEKYKNKYDYKADNLKDVIGILESIFKTDISSKF